MPRQARLDAPGILHHIIIRGIERREIFLNDDDRSDFLDRLDKLLPDTEVTCYAWALMPNHAHFLLRTGTVPIAKFMSRLLTGYAVTFNRRHKRHGHLFQNRYRSIICQEDAYFKKLVRYIHLNPLRAKIVPDLQSLRNHPYCGHGALIGETKTPWQDVNYVLGYFGETTDSAQDAYLGYMSAGAALGRIEELTGGGLIRSLGGWTEVKRRRKTGAINEMGDERILGDSAFVDSILSRADEKLERHYELKRLGYDLNCIAKKSAEIYGMESGELFTRGRQQRKVQARSLMCFWAVRELGMSIKDLARKLSLSAPAVSFAVERGKIIARENNYRLMD